MQYGWVIIIFSGSVNEGENGGADANANANIQDEWFLTVCLVSYLAM